jgi:nitrate reductase cytochrome c-type subunit
MLPKRPRPWLAALAFLASAAAASPGASAPAAAPPPHAKKPVEVQAEPPPFSEGIFPCMQCHADQKDRTRRELGFHDEQQAVFDHDSENRWCLDCHDYENRDVLRLASGATVPFTESYRLCGQCHGDKYRDWRAGVHGKRVGQWDGEKTYFLCVNCHNPHSPRFKGVTAITVGGKASVAPTRELLRPEPRPQRPEEMRP